MKLLTPFAQKDARNAELAREVLRTQGVKKAVDDWNKRMNKAEDDFKAMTDRHIKELEKRREEHDIEVKMRQAEIEKLEVQRKKLLEPVGLLRKNAENLLSDAQDLMNKAIDKDKDCDELAEKLQDKLDEVGYKEAELSKEEALQASQRQGIEAQKASISLQSEQFKDILSTFNTKKEMEEQSLKDRRIALSLQEINIKSREDKINDKEKELNEWAIRLHDERKLLDENWKRLKNIPIQ